MIIAIDFDGTVVEHKWPRIGQPMPDAFRVIKKLKEAGHEIILWTCRNAGQSDDDEGGLKAAIKFCQDNGIEFDSHNENLDRHLVPGTLQFKEHQKKIYADVYIDDRNIGGFPGWDAVDCHFFHSKHFTIKTELMLR